MNSLDSLRWQARRVQSNWRWSLSLLVPAVTLGLLPFRSHLELGTVLLLHLLAVVLVAALGTVEIAVLAAVVAVSLVNWVFTLPYGSLQIANPRTVVDLTVFLVVATTLALVVRRSRRSEAHAEQVEVERAQVEEIDRSRTALLAAIGHDLRTPIATIKATASGVIARDVQWSASDLADAWALIDEESDRLADLLTNLLDQARLEAGSQMVKTTEIEVADLARSHRVPGIRVRLEVPSDLPLVVADPGLMERVMHNIVANVQRHGGVNADVLISAARDGEYVQLIVDDNGRGVSADRLDVIFQPFQVAGDRVRGGTGLGMAIVKAFVEAMGGTVAASASPRGGLRVTISLPVAP